MYIHIQSTFKLMTSKVEYLQKIQSRTCTVTINYTVSVMMILYAHIFWAYDGGTVFYAKQSLFL